MRISDWSSDVCSSDLQNLKSARLGEAGFGLGVMLFGVFVAILTTNIPIGPAYSAVGPKVFPWLISGALILIGLMLLIESLRERSEEHTSELQSLMRISYAVFCLKNTKIHKITKVRHKAV